MFTNIKLNNITLLRVGFVRLFSKNNKLINNALHNLKILEKNNKNSYLIDKLKNDLNNANHNDIIYINETIKNIYLSYSIQEALSVLDNNKNISKIQYYQLQYQYNYYNNVELEKLFKNIEKEIKIQYSNRNTFNLLPFYYNIYISQFK